MQNHEEPMREISLLSQSKETDRKLRWSATVDDGTEFELYIPKEQVPDPWPRRIYVEIWGPEDNPLPRPADRISNDAPIVEHVRFDRNHTRTARYTPLVTTRRGSSVSPTFPLSCCQIRLREI